MVTVKDSGIEWLGMCPAHWQFLRGKYIFSLRNEKGNTKELQLLSPTQKFGVIPQSLFEELTTNTTVKVKESTDLSQFKTIHKGDFCISLRSFQGGFEYCLYEGVVSPAYQVFYPTLRICDNYYKYLFKGQSFIRKMNSYTLSLRDGKNIAFADFANTYLPLPPLSEQEEIASFLDEKCLEIEKLVIDIQAEIDILDEYKYSIITEKVTKGLNPDVEMKDSGIEWVGSCPAHWKVMSNKYIMKRVKYIKTVYEDEDILSLTTRGVVIRDLDAGGKMPSSFNGYQILYPHNLLMCLFDYDVTPRCIGLIKNYGLSSPAYSQFAMLNQNYEGYYYYYYLMIDNTKALLHLAKNLRHSFTEEQLGFICAPVPPQEEQCKIADYLDKKCVEIDSIIEMKKEQLIVLDEYKQATICEYVTGKKEVI